MASKGQSRKRKLLHIRHRSRPGTPAGTIQVDPQADRSSIRAIAYSPHDLVELVDLPVSAVASLLQKWPVVWLDVTGLGSSEILQELGQTLQLHPLALEDVINLHQRAKFDPYDDNLFLVARMCNPGESTQTEQISFFVKPGLVLSFQERPGDCWNPLRERLRFAKGRLRHQGPDYLLHALLDAIIDSYYPIVDKISDDLDQLDAEIAAGQRHDQMQRIHDTRGNLLALRRALRPHREMVNDLTRKDSPILTDGSKVFFRDCYDHVIQLIELVDTYRELAGDIRDFYMSATSNRLNEVMKVLTMFSTLFMPLSFIAGVYGMNFDTDSPWNMPELGWRHGYLFAWSLMVSTAAAMLWLFRKRTWL